MDTDSHSARRFWWTFLILISYFSLAKISIAERKQVNKKAEFYTESVGRIRISKPLRISHQHIQKFKYRLSVATREFETSGNSQLKSGSNFLDETL